MNTARCVATSAAKVVDARLGISVRLHPGIQLKSLLRSRNEDDLNVNGEDRDSLLTVSSMCTNVAL